MNQRLNKLPITVFCAYSHKDEKLRAELETHLSVLKRQEFIRSWYDGKIMPGEEWQHAISRNLENADVIILLISSFFIASDYCYDKELRNALERHEAGTASVIPVIVRPVDWQLTELRKLQALPKDGKPVTSWPDRHKAWLNVVQGVRSVIEQFNSTSTVSAPDATRRTFKAASTLKFPHPNEYQAKKQETGTARFGFPDLVNLDYFYDAVIFLTHKGLITGYSDGTFRPRAPISRGALAQLVSTAAGWNDEPETRQVFEDVPLNNSYFIYLSRFTSRGLNIGIQCGGFREPCIAPLNRPYFHPQSAATRADLCMLIALACQFQESVEGQTFEDVSATNPIYPFVERLARRDIVGGYPCGTIESEPCKSPFESKYFRPFQLATRADIAMAITRAFFHDEEALFRAKNSTAT